MEPRNKIRYTLPPKPGIIDPKTGKIIDPITGMQLTPLQAYCLGLLYRILGMLLIVWPAMSIVLRLWLGYWLGFWWWR